MSLETATSPQLQDACQPFLVALMMHPFDGTVLTVVLWVPTKSFLPEELPVGVLDVYE